MDMSLVPEIKLRNWKMVGNQVVVEGFRSNLLMNETMALVWKNINSINSIQKIIDLIDAEYGEENQRVYIEEIVNEAIDILINEDMIVVREDDGLGGWFINE